MTEDEFFEAVDSVLRASGSVPEEGEEFRTPPLDVLRYYARGVRFHWLPYLGKGQGVVAVVRQPPDVGFGVAGYRTLLERVGLAVNGRFPPFGRFQGGRPGSGGLALGLTAVVLTPEPVGPGDDGVLRSVVGGKPLTRQRAVPLGLLRVNLGQEALAFALASGPVGAFPEPLALADALAGRLRRFVDLLEE